MRAWNLTRARTLLGDAIQVANTSAARRRGLLKHRSLEPGQGLWIVPCEAVHTFGMKFPIDVVFLNRRRQVVKIKPNLQKNRIAVCLRAYSVLELPAGIIGQTQTQPGDQLLLEP